MAPTPYKRGQKGRDAKVPTDLLRPYLQNLVIPQDVDNSAQVILSKIREGSQKFVLWSTADRLMVKAGLPDWGSFKELQEFYWEGNVPPDLSKPVQCAAEDCENWFELVPHGLHKRYCSSTCENRESQYRRGIRTRPSKRSNKCPQGHDKAIYGNKYGRCALCKRDRQTAKRRELKAQSI